MRMMLRVMMDTAAANKAAQDGTMQKTLQRLFDDLKPEAAYFTTQDGQRGGYFFFDMKDPSEMPVIAEPLFAALGARLTWQPVMSREDLMAGLQKAAQRR